MTIIQGNEISKEDLVVIQETNVRMRRRFGGIAFRTFDIDDVLSEAQKRWLENRRMGLYQETGKLAQYYGRTVRIVFLEYSRRDYKEQALHSSLDLKKHNNATLAKEGNSLVQRESIIFLLKKAFILLDQRSKNILIHKYLEGKSAKEIGLQYGIKENTVNQRIYACKVRLRNIIETKDLQLFSDTVETQLERYLNGLMTEGEQRAFEQRLQEDSAFEKTTEYIMALMFVVRHNLGISTLKYQPSLQTNKKFWSSSISLKPLLITGIGVLGLLFIVISVFPQHKRIARSFLEKYPPSFLMEGDPYYAELEQLYVIEKDFDQVIEKLTNRVIQKRDCWFCEIQIGYTYLVNQEPQEAIKIFERKMIEKGEKINKTYPYLPFYYALALLLDDRKEEAVSVLDKRWIQVENEYQNLQDPIKELREKLD